MHKISLFLILTAFSYQSHAGQIIKYSCGDWYETKFKPLESVSIEFDEAFQSPVTQEFQFRTNEELPTQATIDSLKFKSLIGKSLVFTKDSQCVRYKYNGHGARDFYCSRMSEALPWKIQIQDIKLSRNEVNVVIYPPMVTQTWVSFTGLSSKKKLANPESITVTCKRQSL